MFATHFHERHSSDLGRCTVEYFATIAVLRHVVVAGPLDTAPQGESPSTTMERPTRNPPKPAAAATEVARTEINSVSSRKQEPVFSREDIALMLSLDPHIAGSDAARKDMLALISPAETRAALIAYEGYFKTAGIDVRPTIDSSTHVNELLRLRRRTEIMLSVIKRHIQTVGSPNVETISALHKTIAGSADNSPIRMAFSLFEENWKQTFKPSSSKKKSKNEKLSEDK
jgi:hypothetical protein